MAQIIKIIMLFQCSHICEECVCVREREYLDVITENLLLPTSKHGE